MKPHLVTVRRACAKSFCDRIQLQEVTGRKSSPMPDNSTNTRTGTMLKNKKPQSIYRYLVFLYVLLSNKKITVDVFRTGS